MFPWKTTNPVAVNPRKAVEPVKSCKRTKATRTNMQGETQDIVGYRLINSGEASGPLIISMVMGPTQNHLFGSNLKPHNLQRLASRWRKHRAGRLSLTC